jgi:hypothetical protein
MMNYFPDNFFKSAEGKKPPVSHLVPAVKTQWRKPKNKKELIASTASQKKFLF